MSSLVYVEKCRAALRSGCPVDIALTTSSLLISQTFVMINLVQSGENLPCFEIGVIQLMHLTLS